MYYTTVGGREYLPTEKTDNNGHSPVTGRFVAGNKCGTGRPKHITTKIREMSNDYEDYIVMLDNWARNENLPITFQRMCVLDLLDRGLGRPSQHVQTEDVTPEKIEYIKEDGGTKE